MSPLDELLLESPKEAARLVEARGLKVVEIIHTAQPRGAQAGSYLRVVRAQPVQGGVSLTVSAFEPPSQGGQDID